MAQSAYPSKPIKLIVPFSPGGGVDLIGRLLAIKLGDRLGQSIIVENRPGASSMLGSDAVAKSAPDGYTLLLSSTAIAANQSLFRKVPYDVSNDFTPIGLIANAPAIVVVHPAVPAATVQQLMTLSNAKPESLTYASYGNGSAPHLTGELFKQATRIRALHVPYKGGGPAVMATLAGETSILIPSLVPVLSHVREGKLRAIAIASQQRHPLLPEVPTLIEQGVKLETGTWFGLMAPAKMPIAITRTLTDALAFTLNDKDLREKLIAEGAVPAALPIPFGPFVASEVIRWREVIQRAGIQAD